MSNIQIILPLDLLNGAKSLTAEGIQEYLADAIEFKAKADRAQDNEKALAQRVVDWSNQLENILNGDHNDFQKAQLLRELSSEARQFTNFVKGQIQ